MRRTIAVLAILALALVPSALSAHGQTEVIVRGHIHPNGPIELEGKEFAPNDVVRLELHKENIEDIVLGLASADEDGAFSVTLHVPATVLPALYQLVAVGEDTATAEVPVLEPPAGATGEGEAEPEAPAAPITNDRPVDEVAGLAAFAAVLALAAAGLLWLSRTRPRSAHG